MVSVFLIRYLFFKTFDFICWEKQNQRHPRPKKREPVERRNFPYLRNQKQQMRGGKEEQERERKSFRRGKYRKIVRDFKGERTGSRRRPTTRGGAIRGAIRGRGGERRLFNAISAKITKSWRISSWSTRETQDYLDPENKQHESHKETLARTQNSRNERETRRSQQTRDRFTDSEFSLIQIKMPYSN